MSDHVSPSPHLAPPGNECIAFKQHKITITIHHKIYTRAQLILPLTYRYCHPYIIEQAVITLISTFNVKM